MKNEAGLRPMKRGFAARRGTGASLHASAASASQKPSGFCFTFAVGKRFIRIKRGDFCKGLSHSNGEKCLHLFQCSRTLRCMKNKAGLRPMKRGFAARRGTGASLHASAASASRKPSGFRFTFANGKRFIDNGQIFVLYSHYKGSDGMANDKLAEYSMDFSVQIINLVRKLKEQRESIISNQIGRSGTSIGANIREAKYAHGKADFVSKLQIALKEANETGYWLELLHKTNYIDAEQYSFLESKCKSLRAMLVSSINTAKENSK